MQRTYRLLLVSLLSLSHLSGCGFHLRGYSETEAFKRVHQVNLICPNTTNWQLCQALRQDLKLNGLSLDETADTQLRISPIKQNSRTLSIQDNAAAAEYGLTSSVTYQISRANDLVVLLERSISVQHSYRHESTELLAKDREREELQTELSHQLAHQIFNQLNVLNSKGMLKASMENASGTTSESESED